MQGSIDKIPGTIELTNKAKREKCQIGKNNGKLMGGKNAERLAGVSRFRCRDVLARFWISDGFDCNGEILKMETILF